MVTTGLYGSAFIQTLAYLPIVAFSWPCQRGPFSGTRGTLTAIITMLKIFEKVSYSHVVKSEMPTLFSDLCVFSFLALSNIFAVCIQEAY